MGKEKVYVGSVGTEILADTKLPLAGATVSLLVMKPNGVEVTWDGEIYNTTCVRHTTADKDLDVSGDYRVQPQILSADESWKIPGATGTFHVYNKFE